MLETIKDNALGRAGASAVKHEVIKPHVHEVNTVIDKDVHEDHYHRTVQPVLDREVLPEKHTAKLGAVQHREFDHRDQRIAQTAPPRTPSSSRLRSALASF
ncbi:hypothetical protein CFE70_003971 [Pyrenophora teres f. teres 0-1]|uniref:Uncharacterized protein n=1 Tax=Pyrenophora teres f. teres (strain 0-1) TaxID=861557 RepID=E3RY86_PYRTT|nr:hypothetical protein PTT_14469 [Pyrenophora teres f. teres 0-1]